MRKYLSLVVIVSMIGMAQPAWAGDEELFAGLIPGVPVADRELSEIYGRGGVEINVQLADGSILNLEDLAINNAPVDNSTATNNTHVTDNSGIAQITPIAGDFNTINNIVLIEVKINTVELNDVSGSSLTVTQNLDFNGLVTLFNQ